MSISRGLTEQLARLQRQATQERELATEWEKKVVLAIKAGSDSLAKEAMKHALEHADAAARFERESESLQRLPSSPADPTGDVDVALGALRKKMGSPAPPPLQGAHAFDGLVKALLAIDAKKDGTN